MLHLFTGDPCWSAWDPCQNNGTCWREYDTGQYGCYCAYEWIGVHCQWCKVTQSHVLFDHLTVTSNTFIIL